VAKRAPKEDRPYSPIATALVQRTASGRADSQQLGEKMSLRLAEKGENSGEPETETAAVRRQGREKRVILSWEDECALQRFLEEISLELETPIKLSNILRACVMLLRHTEESIRSSARNSSAFIRPANNDQPGLAIFEYRLAQLLLMAFKEGPGLE